MEAICAYLNGSLKETVYMQQPEMFEDGTNKVCKFQRSLYGLKQSGRVWNETINRELLNIGLTRRDVDQCIYYKVTNTEILYVAIYVDDFLIFSNNLNLVKMVKEKLCRKFKMKAKCHQS